MAKHDLKLHTFETAPEAWRKQRGALMRGRTLSQGPGGILGSRGEYDGDQRRRRSP
jgi:hypothetical protein